MVVAGRSSHNGGGGRGHLVERKPLRYQSRPYGLVGRRYSASASMTFSMMMTSIDDNRIMKLDDVALYLFLACFGSSGPTLRSPASLRAAGSPHCEASNTKALLATPLSIAGYGWEDGARETGGDDGGGGVTLT